MQDTTSLDKTATTPTSTVPIDRLRPYFRYDGCNLCQWIKTSAIGVQLD